MPLYDFGSPLEPDDLIRFRPALDNLQGNVLKPHGRSWASHVFIQFETNPKHAVRFLRSVGMQVTSATVQDRQTRDREKTGSEYLFEQCMISAAGYRFLQLPLDRFDYVFSRGMQHTGKRLADPPVSDWEQRYQAAIHAMVLVAHSDPVAVQQRVQEIAESLHAIGSVFVEPGQALFRVNGRGRPQQIEHFGFCDGVSQPIFFAQDLPRNRESWDPGAGPSLILRPDPLGLAPDDCGTYFVFRKLEQNLRGFRKRLDELANALGLFGGEQGLAGALVMGRFEDGTPVAVSGCARAEAEPADNFTYAQDPRGNRCPFSSHIRKANPRGETGDLAMERSRRIARRGIPYGTPPLSTDDPELLPETGLGLLFQCCCRDLNAQFEFLQAGWCENEHFPKTGTGTDPVMGRVPLGPISMQSWPNPWNSDRRLPFRFQDFVRMRGGEYFFVPSISFLRSLV